MSSKRSSKATSAKEGGTKKSSSAANANNGMKTSKLHEYNLAIPVSGVPDYDIRPYFETHPDVDTKADCYQKHIPSMRLKGRDFLTTAQLAPSSWNANGLFRSNGAGATLKTYSYMALHPLMQNGINNANVGGYANFGCLSRIAVMFKRYKFRSFTLHYLPFTSSTQTGGVALAVTANASLNADHSKFVSASSGTAEDSGYTIMRLYPAVTPKQAWKPASVSLQFVGPKTYPVGYDFYQSDTSGKPWEALGVNQFFQGAILAGGVNIEAGTSLGVFYIEFDIDFYDMSGPSPNVFPVNGPPPEAVDEKKQVAAQAAISDSSVHVKAAASSACATSVATGSLPDVIEDYVLVKKAKPGADH